MIDNDLLLYLPLNEKPGSAIAYDYSRSRKDAPVNGGVFVQGYNGNALSLDGYNDFQIDPDVIPVEDDFTLLFSITSNQLGNAFQYGLLLSFDDESTETVWRSMPAAGNYDHVTAIRSGDEFKVLVNGSVVETIDLTEYDDLIGVSLIQDYPTVPFGVGILDNVRVYGRALNAVEIGLAFSKPSEVKYSIDGLSLKDYFETIVSGSSGVIDGLKMKEPFKAEWDDYHGEVIDLSSPRYEAREISLDCWVKASGMLDFSFKVKKLVDQLTSAGLHRLKIEVDPTRPLVYEVYMQDGISIAKKWNAEDMVGTFTLKLREPEPVKKVLRHIRSSEGTKTASISLTSPKVLTIFWGDGATTRNVKGSQTITHDYQEDGEFEIIIAGVVEDITSFTTNAIVVWERL